MQQPLIFDIKRYAINDGPGIRLTIFFKGCPLSCAWCHNPESISAKQQKLFTKSKCIGCGECVKVCPLGAMTMTAVSPVTDPLKCQLCGECAEVCPTRAIEMSGRHYQIAELMEIVEKERPFFAQSEGGVTISGGEPLLHPDYLLRLLRACGEQHIHRAVDTSGFCSPEILLEVAKHTDLFLYDLKMIDDGLHRRFTGVSNRRILDNLQLLAVSGAQITLRIPVIGGVNADAGSASAIADFVAGLEGGARDVHLLPYHGVAAGKHLKLGGQYDEGLMREPSTEELKRFGSCFAARGLGVVVGG
ncbi:MAG: glycyl-radical enzyme activating protein [Desulfuromonas sp.]|nr:MAG: glycyl-radical enzyme activating protein [Desulfuromonas sp.]